MAGRKITQLPTLTTPAATDKLVIVDVSDTSESPQGTSKQIAFENLGITSIESSSLDVTIDGGVATVEGISGTWTPVASDVTNDAIVTLTGGIYSRTGNVVTAGFNWEVQLDAGQQDTAFTVNLPVASSFTSATDLNGSITGTLDNGVQTISDFSIRAGDGVLEVTNFSALINGGTFSGSMMFIYIIR